MTKKLSSRRFRGFSRRGMMNKESEQMTSFTNVDEWHPPKELANKPSATPPTSPSAKSASNVVVSPPKVHRKSPTTNRGIDTNAKRQFWETVFTQKGSGSGDQSSSDDEDLVKHNVMDKKKWLQEAFTPTGGGNMPQNDDYSNDEDPTEDLTMTESEAIDLEEDIDQVLFSKKTPTAPGQAYSYTPPKSTGTVSYDAEDPYQDAYRIWQQKGLLPSEESNEQPKKTAASPDLPSPSGTTTDAQGAYHHAVSFKLEDSSSNNSASTEEHQGGKTVAGSGKMLLVETPANSSFEGGDPQDPAKKPLLVPLTEEPYIQNMTSSRQSSMDKSHKSPMLSIFGGSLSSQDVAFQRLEAYHDYVKAYRSYIRDRQSPEKARETEEARHLLAVAKAI